MTGRYAPFRDARRLAHFAWRVDGAKFAGVLAMMIFASLTEGLSIVLLVPLLRLIGPDQQSVSFATPAILSPFMGTRFTTGLIPVLATFVGVVSLRAVLTRIKDIYEADLMYDFTNKLRIGVFAAVAKARWEMLLRVRISDLNHALTADIDRVQIATMQLLSLFQSLVLLAAYLAVSLMISPALTACATLVGATAILVLYPVRQRAARYGASLTNQRQEQYRIVNEFLGGLKVAKSLNAEPLYIRDLDHVLTDMRHGTIGFLRLSTFGTTLFQVISAAGVALFVYLAIRVFTTPIAEIVVMILLFIRIAPRVVSLQGNLQDVIVNLNAFTAMLELRRQCHVEREPDDGASLAIGTAPATISFSAVEFSYAVADRIILKGLSFDLPAGRITTIVGPSGSGKSTIADLLLRLLDPSAGMISVDGMPLNTIDRTAWREQIAYVQQDSYLSHTSIAENFRLSRRDATESEMWAALTAANADAFVRTLPDQLDSVVGERGVRLSGGERQRIALARALLRRPSLLILDEATSSLDWDSRTLVIQSIEALRGEITILAIDHGYGMAAIADQVIVLTEGRVVETGTSEELLTSSGGYLRGMLANERTPKSTAAQ